MIICFSPFAQAQFDQIGSLEVNTTDNHGNSMPVVSFNIEGFAPSGCDSVFKYSVNFANEPSNLPSSDNQEYWPSIPGGNGMQQFTARVNYKIWHSNFFYRYTPQSWAVYIDGELCVDCSADVLPGFGNYDCYNTTSQLIEVNYPGQDSLDSDIFREFALRPIIGSTAYNCNDYCNGAYILGECVGFWEDYGNTNAPLTPEGVAYDVQAPEIRFKAVMVGSVFTDVLGSFTTPENLTCILRDPPGDRSYSEWRQDSTQCFGSSLSAGTGVSASAWGKVKLGFGIPDVYEVNYTGGVTASVSVDNTENFEFQTCIETSTTKTTNDAGKADDLFIGSSVEYNYGMARTTVRENCQIVSSVGLVMAPVSTISSFTYPESYIRDTEIPAIEALLDNETPGTVEYENILSQLDQWYQCLALNDEIKANAPDAPIETFLSGAGQSYSISSTTSQTKSINMKVRLSAGLNFEYCEEIGGSSVSAGGEFNVSREYGSGANASNSSTNTMFYYLRDDDAGVNGGSDFFRIKVKEDKIFGSFVFELIEDGSTTSCPYEGGIPVEQPQLWVGGIGQTTMEVNDLDPSGSASYDILLSNNSSRTVNYKLSLNPNTNGDGAIVSAFGTNLVGTSYSLELTAGQTLEGTITLERPSNFEVFSFEDLEIIMGSNCDDESIGSSVFISAQFDPVGIDDSKEILNAWFTVSPNPSNGIFRFMPKGTNQTMTISVTDLLGRTVFAPTLTGGSGNTEIDLSHVSNGMYVLVAERDGERKTTRLMVEH